jgi:transposase
VRLANLSFQGTYTVDNRKKCCTCPDYEERQQPCKHVFAVEFFVKRETRTTADGATTVTETHGVRLTTYPQPWAAYNRAQTTEKEAFCDMLRDLCAGIPEPEQTRGRPRLPLSDTIFAAAFKVYSGFSGRRFMTDLRDAKERGLIAHTPHYNSVFNVIESEAVTPILHDLTTASSLALREVEVDFAADSTGFGTSQFFRYYSMKYQREQLGHDWVKCHAMIGVKTNIITAVTITKRNANDYPHLYGLVKATARNFTMREVSADKAHSGKFNSKAIVAVGAQPFIPFRSNAAERMYSPLWNKLLHFFSMNRVEFLAHYHKRSNVEATFSAIKRVFGDSVRSRTAVAQHNEVLLKVLCHNIRTVIHAMHELGITPDFGCPNSPAAAQEVTPA